MTATINGAPLTPLSNTESELDYEYLRRLFFSRLDEQQRRWYAALEALREGYGGNKEVAQSLRIDVKTIRRGRRELQSDLQERPCDRVRLAGGGRPRIEKKTAD